MTGKRQGGIIPALLCGWLAGLSSAPAQTVPLPRPAPFPKEAAGQPQSAPAANGLTSFLDRLFSGKSPIGSSGDAGSGFDPSQQALVNRVSNYLSSIQVLTGKFVQIGPDGRRTAGQLFIQKPGKVRFEYDPPSPIDIVADGQAVAVRDRQLATQDIYQLSQTPLRYLLAERIDLLRDTNVVGVSSDNSFVSVTIDEKQVLIGTSRLVVTFDAKDFRLKQWTITDPQGYDTTVMVSNLDSSKRPDPNLFKIDYTRYIQ